MFSTFEPPPALGQDVRRRIIISYMCGGQKSTYMSMLSSFTVWNSKIKQVSRPGKCLYLLTHLTTLKVCCLFLSFEGKKWLLWLTVRMNTVYCGRAGTGAESGLCHQAENRSTKDVID